LGWGDEGRTTPGTWHAEFDLALDAAKQNLSDVFFTLAGLAQLVLQFILPK
jgi:hypothetical protein